MTAKRRRRSENDVRKNVRMRRRKNPRMRMRRRRMGSENDEMMTMKRKMNGLKPELEL